MWLQAAVSDFISAFPFSLARAQDCLGGRFFFVTLGFGGGQHFSQAHQRLWIIGIPPS